MPKKNPWLKYGLDAWLVGLEASSVIALRSMQAAAGGVKAQAECQRMIQEKIAAAIELQIRAATGGLGFTPHGVARKTLLHYRRKVRANKRRLLKG